MGECRVGRLERVDLRSVWPRERHDFVPWLARPDNLALLGEAAGPRQAQRARAIHGGTVSGLIRELGIDVPREVCELALAHVNSDRVEAAYRRTDLFDRRRALMEQWSEFVVG